MKVTVNWLEVETQEHYEDAFPVKAPLQAVKVILLAASGWASPGDADQYVVKVNPKSPPLDESQSLEDLGITDGSKLCLAKA